MAVLPPEISDPRIWAFWIGVALQGVVALAVLLVASKDARHRAFALLVAVNAAWDLALGFLLVATDAATQLAYARASNHFGIWTKAALIAFLFIYPTRRRHAHLVIGLLAVAAPITTVALALRPDLWANAAGEGGPLMLTALLWMPLLVVTSLVMVLDGRGKTTDPSRLVVTMALLVYPLGTFAQALDASRWTFGPNALNAIADISYNLAFATAPLVAIAVIAQAWKTGARPLAAFLGAVATALVGISFLIEAGIDTFSGLAAISFGLLTGYALARTKLFDLDLRLKWTLSRGTVAAIFLAVFFVVAQVAGEFLSNTYGYLAGGAAAGILVFAFNPLQRAAERIADRAMPQAQATPEYFHTRKLEVYRAALEGALTDGEITPKERDILIRLQLELGIANADARTLESELTATTTK